MNALTPIPTPPALRWREFRIKILPGFVFLAVLSLSALIWSRHVSPTVVSGQVEGILARVTSSQPGILSQLQVARFKPVRAGEKVATVITTDPKVLAASLAVIKAEVGLLQVGMLPLLDRGRNELDFERFRLDLLDHRARLAGARISLQYAEAELQRVQQLYQAQTNIVSRGEYDIAVRDRNLLQVEIDEETQIVSGLERSLDRLRLSDPTKAPKSDDTLRAAIAVQEEKLRFTEAQLSPLVLTAPIDGIVSMIYRYSGETIAAGEPLVAIESAKPERIVAYLRQPLTLEPQVGMQAEIRTRTLTRTRGFGRVEEVMPYMEPIPPVLLAPLNNKTVEMGLPIAVTIPAGLKLRVGEIVDLDLRLRR